MTSLCLALALIGLTGPAAQQDDIASLEAQFRTAAGVFEAGDELGFVTLVADDAVFMLPGEPPVTGKDAIEQRLLDFFEQYMIDLSWEIQSTEVAGDLGLQRVTYTAALVSFSARDMIQGRGKGLVVWEPDPLLGWRIRDLIFNQSAEAAQESQR